MNKLKDSNYFNELDDFEKSKKRKWKRCKSCNAQLIGNRRGHEKRVHDGDYVDWEIIKD